MYNGIRMKNGFAVLGIILGIVIGAFVVGGAAYLYNRSNQSTSTTPQTPSTPTSTTPETPTTPPSPAPSSPSTIPTDWKSFTNSSYKYTFRYPPSGEVASGDMGATADKASNVSVFAKPASQDSQWLSIEVKDPEGFNGLKECSEDMKLGLKEYAQRIWDRNKNDDNPNIKNKTISPIQTVTFAGRTAYQFNLTVSYSDGCGGYLLDEETTYVFVDRSDGLKFQIYYPAGVKDFEQIASSFKFTQ